MVVASRVSQKVRVASAEILAEAIRSIQVFEAVHDVVFVVAVYLRP